MLKTFESIQKNFKLKPTTYFIDNIAFKLHYRLTTLLFLVATILVTSREYIGEHIRCINDAGVASHVMNTFCFFTTTFTVVKHMDPELLERGYVAHPGVGPYGIRSDEPIRRHAYYQWVPFLLFGQAIMFYLPHLLWKKIEGGRIKRLVEGLDYAAFALSDNEITVKGNKIPPKKAVDEKLAIIRRIFIDRFYLGNYWTAKLIGCEILNLLNTILQIYIVDQFLGGKFYNLGTELAADGFDASVDVLDEVFPKVTKCTFHKYGPSGSIQLHDAMCVMALNVINEKIYIFFWYWFIFLVIASTLALLWRLLTILLHARSKKFNELVFSATCPGKLNPWRVLTVTKQCNYSDWLFLKYLAKNIDGLVFRELFVGLAEDLEDRKPLVSDEDDNDSGTYLKGEKEPFATGPFA